MSIDTKSADSCLQQDVDELILDYVLFGAVKALLQDFAGAVEDGREPTGNPKTERHVDLADGFLSIHASLYKNQCLELELDLRRRLLKFFVAFTRRHPSYETSSAVASDKTGGPESDGYSIGVSFNTAHPPKSKTSGFAQGSQPLLPSPSLLHILPSFMALSAAQSALRKVEVQDDEEHNLIPEGWMRLAAELMAQAVLEQYVVYETRHSNVIEKAFNWGIHHDPATKEGTDDELVNAMFFDDEEQIPNPLWVEIRNEYMSMLEPPPGMSNQEYARRLLKGRHSGHGFAKLLLEFLEFLHNSLPTPLLIQVETGRIDGMSEEQARMFRNTICRQPEEAIEYYATS